MPTTSLSSAWSITAAVNPPRAAFVDHPLGRTAGKPDDRVGQRRIVSGALRLLETANEPGRIVDLGERWGDDAWRANPLGDGAAASGSDPAGGGASGLGSGAAGGSSGSAGGGSSGSGSDPAGGSSSGSAGNGGSSGSAGDGSSGSAGDGGSGSAGADSRTARHGTPQYQTPEDARLAAERRGADVACVACAVFDD